MKNVKYDYAISAVRFISMLMIITCHFMQYLHLELAWWFNVGVQIFFVISGFLYGQKTITSPLSFYKKSFLKLLIPYWIFLFVVAVLQKILVPEIFSWGNTFLAFLCLARLPGIEHLWFVQTILICYLILPLLLALKNELLRKKPFKAILGTIIVLLILQFVGFSFNGYLMSPNRIMCFATGILLSGIVQKGKTLVIPTIAFSIAAVLMNSIRIYIHYFQGIQNNKSQLFDLFTKYAHGVLGVALFLVLYLLFKNVKSSALLWFSDKYSYHIYLVHQVFILGPFSLMALSDYLFVNVFIICCLILLSGVLLNIISNKVSLFIKNMV